MSRLYTFTTVTVLALILVLVHSAHAHKPLLAVEDNMDGTMYIEAGFSDGVLCRRAQNRREGQGEWKGAFRAPSR